jgi:hypothetical protein
MNELTASLDCKASEFCRAYTESGGTKSTFGRAKDALVNEGRIVGHGTPMVLSLIPQGSLPDFDESQNVPE